MATKKKAVGPLGEFDGKEVLSTTVAVTNAGDGLSRSLGVDPQAMFHGDVVFVVLECEVVKVRFDRIKDADGKLQRVHILKAGAATIVDETLVRDALDAQLLKIEEAAGVQRIEFGEGTDAEGDPYDD